MAGNRIEELFAWVTLDDGDGNEGIIAYTLPGLGTVPAVGANRAYIENLRSVARMAARMHSHPVELRLFAPMTVLEMLDPGKPAPVVEERGRKPRLFLHQDRRYVSIGFEGMSDTLLQVPDGERDQDRVEKWVDAVSAIIDEVSA